MMIARQTTPMIMIFKTRFEPCRWKVCAEVGPFCRKGLRSVAATCDRTCFDGKIMSSAITAPLFVLRCAVPLTVRLAAKVLSGRKDLQKSPNRIAVKLLFPYATGRRSTTGLLEQVPRSWDPRASARMARTATSPLRSTRNRTQRPPSALAKSKPYALAAYSEVTRCDDAINSNRHDLLRKRSESIPIHCRHARTHMAAV